VSETDWEGRYQAGETSWDKGAASPGLVDFLETHPELPRGSVLVPGCGMGHDVRAWAAAGFQATGLDVAPSAIRQAQERTAPSSTAGFMAGNFLEQPPSGFDWVFEHTLFCAINPARRDAYVHAVIHSLKPGGQFLAVHYMLRENSNEPPFGCTQEELMDRFQTHFELLRGWVPRSHPNRTGLELMLWWKRRQ
jgi:hypothetical protein